MRSISTPANIKYFFLVCSCYLVFLQQYLQCCLRHSAFQFASGSWSADYLFWLADSWALGESACSPFYENNSLQGQFSSGSIGGSCIVKETKFSVALPNVSQQASTF